MEKKLLKENMSTHLVTIGWMDSMENAFKRMQLSRIRHLPVIHESGEVIGMLSDRDVQRSMISEIERPFGQILSDETIDFNPESKVRDYMSWPAKAVEQDTDLRWVTERMVAEKVSSLLVCDGHRTVGIVTVEDLMKVLIELLSEKPTKSWTLNHVLDGSFGQLRNTLL